MLQTYQSEDSSPLGNTYACTILGNRSSWCVYVPLEFLWPQPMGHQQVSEAGQTNWLTIRPKIVRTQTTVAALSSKKTPFVSVYGVASMLSSSSSSSNFERACPSGNNHALQSVRTWRPQGRKNIPWNSSIRKKHAHPRYAKKIQTCGWKMHQVQPGWLAQLPWRPCNPCQRQSPGQPKERCGACTKGNPHVPDPSGSHLHITTAWDALTTSPPLPVAYGHRNFLL